MFTLERLQALAAVATHGSIARAAGALHVTPSGLSQRLEKLEREAGHRLLEPQGRSVRLTHAGRVLAAHADTVVSQVATAEADLADLSEEVLGHLRLGAVGSAARAFLPPVLAELTREHPRLVPTVRDGEVEDLVPLLLSGDLDLLLIESWDNRPLPLPEGLATEPLAEEDVRVALSERHRLAGRDLVDLAELEDAVWASCPPGTEPYEALVQALRANGLEPEVRYTVAEYTTQLALVQENLTAALVPAMARRPAPPGVRFVPTRPPLHRDIRAAWRAHTTSPPMRACMDALRSCPVSRA